MTNVIDKKEAERLMQPDNLGMRLMLFMCRTINPEDTLGVSDQELMGDIAGHSVSELNENLRIVRALEQEILNIIAERGDHSTELLDVGMTEERIKHMVNRFLGWRLPEPWYPDGGVSYKRPNYAHAPAAHDWPVGTNLFDATQAEAMVRYMVEGLPKS